MFDVQQLTKNPVAITLADALELAHRLGVIQTKTRPSDHSQVAVCHGGVEISWQSNRGDDYSDDTPGDWYPPLIWARKVGKAARKNT